MKQRKKDKILSLISDSQTLIAQLQREPNHKKFGELIQMLEAIRTEIKKEKESSMPSGGEP